MGFKAKFAFLWHNYGYPAIYAAGAAMASTAFQALQHGDPLSQQSLAIAGALAALAFLGPRLNPTAGKNQPFIEPHEDAPASKK